MRYQIVDEPKGTWSVVDTDTGKPVDHDGKPAVGLTKYYAYNVMLFLESEHLRSELRRKPTPW